MIQTSQSMPTPLLHVTDIGKVRKVFVYGTLKQNFNLHKYMGDSKKTMSEPYIRGYMFNAGAFPAVVLEDTGSWIRGEVYTCTPEKIAELDMIEGCPDLYVRCCVELSSHDLAWVYVCKRENLDPKWKLLPSAHWTFTNTTTDLSLVAWITQQNYLRGGTHQMQMPRAPWVTWDAAGGVPTVIQDWDKHTVHPGTNSSPTASEGPWVKGLKITWMDEHQQELSRYDSKPEVYGV